MDPLVVQFDRPVAFRDNLTGCLDDVSAVNCGFSSIVVMSHLNLKSNMLFVHGKRWEITINIRLEIHLL